MRKVREQVIRLPSGGRAVKTGRGTASVVGSLAEIEGAVAAATRAGRYLGHTTPTQLGTGLWATTLRLRTDVTRYRRAIPWRTVGWSVAGLAAASVVALVVVMVVDTVTWLVRHSVEVLGGLVLALVFVVLVAHAVGGRDQGAGGVTIHNRIRVTNRITNRR